jgi:hypothetical protein
MKQYIIHAENNKNVKHFKMQNVEIQIIQL